MTSKIPRVTIGGVRGGSGKTLVALGLCAAIRARGTRVIPFKKGPDYIDAAWHTLASGVQCRNLDTFMMTPERALRSFVDNAHTDAISIIEGNRGLFDGVDADGTYSTAALAKLLGSPIILTIDCTKATRTVAAVVLGCREFDPGINLAGVILNRIASSRQERVIREAIEKHAGVEVLGAIPRIDDSRMLERHLGLVPPAEHPDVEHVLGTAKKAVEEHVDIDRLIEIARTAKPLEHDGQIGATPIRTSDERPRIAVVRDSAFNFYYPENLEQLEALGADLVFVSALEDRGLPPIDALYIGGGFPETHAARLAANESFRNALRDQVERGLPVYAECGGLTFLGEAIVIDGTAYPMTGVFPVRFEIAARPVGHGYTIMKVDQTNPFFDIGTTIRGHEFRYSRALDYEPETIKTAAHFTRGKGFDGQRGALCYKNVFASFCHVHALGLTSWASALVDRALQFRRSPTSTENVKNIENVENVDRDIIESSSTPQPQYACSTRGETEG